ncbi:NAD(P)-binding protein, partial [Aureobasidium melanogenum]
IMPVYVLTGANRGLGLEFVRQLSADSSNTVIGAVRSMSNDLADLESLNKNNNIHILECDTGEVSSITSFAESCGKILESKKIDYLLNNSGINAVPEQSSLSITESDMNEHIKINVLGPAKTTEAMYKADLLSSDVRILNMTSGLGSMKVSIGIKPRKCTTYSISKAALNMLTVHQGEELREKLPGAVVISMDPGWVKTRMGGEGALIEAHESISGMLKVLYGLKKDDTASFWTYSGEQVPW